MPRCAELWRKRDDDVPPQPGLVIGTRCGPVMNLGNPWISELPTRDSSFAGSGEHPVISEAPGSGALRPLQTERTDGSPRSPGSETARWWLRQRRERSGGPSGPGHPIPILPDGPAAREGFPGELSFRAGISIPVGGDHDARLVPIDEMDRSAPAHPLGHQVLERIRAPQRLPGGPVPAWMDEPDAPLLEWSNVPMRSTRENGTSTESPGPSISRSARNEPQRCGDPRTTTDGTHCGSTVTTRAPGSGFENPVTFSDTDYEMPDAGLISPRRRGSPSQERSTFATPSWEVSRKMSLRPGGYALELVPVPSTGTSLGTRSAPWAVAASGWGTRWSRRRCNRCQPFSSDHRQPSSIPRKNLRARRRHPVFRLQAAVASPTNTFPISITPASRSDGTGARKPRAGEPG